MSEDYVDEMGPIDYAVLEWRGKGPQDIELADLLLDLSDRGIVRILDVAFLTKDESGRVNALELGDLAAASALFAEFEGAASGLLEFEDLTDAATALEPGTSAMVLVWENRWAAPFATAIRRSGGQLVASGRIPVQALLASLDALETSH